MNKKLFYTQPTTDLLELRVEGSILIVSTLANTIDDVTVEVWDDEL